MDARKKEKKGLDISAKSFLAAIAIIFVLMVAAYVMALIIPGGQYARDKDGVIDIAAGFTEMEHGIPFWKWICSPVLVLGTNGGGTLIAVIAFLLIIGGVFNSLNKSGIMQYMLDRITLRFGGKRYKLLAVIVLFFMTMGSLIGSFEECVPLVPIVATLAVSLGWDAMTGMAMSLLAVGCGFAAGIFNPFTVGVAQKFAGLPIFSGAWLRGISFVLIYAVLMFFIIRHAKKIERPVAANESSVSASKSKEYGRALVAFVAIMGIGIGLVLSSALPLPFAETLQSLSMIIVALSFLVGGIVSVLAAKKGGKFLAKTFFDGLLSMLPAVVMILMASSIRFILEEGNVLDSILHFAIELAGLMPRFVIILFIYLLVLVMNFFIASGSAKAVMLIPLIVPLAGAFNISAQLCVMAFAFGDGFSNVFYPTNPVLLIGLGLTDLSYGKWVKWSWRFQIANLLLTSLLLLFGLAIGYK